MIRKSRRIYKVVVGVPAGTDRKWVNIIDESPEGAAVKGRHAAAEIGEQAQVISVELIAEAEEFTADEPIAKKKRGQEVSA